MISDTTYLSSAFDQAWAEYQGKLEALRQKLYSSPLAREPADQARLHFWFMQAQAAAFNLVIAPKHSHPTFFVNTVFEPDVYTWMLPNADFLYRYAFVDGKQSYRISGRRGSSYFLEAQVISGFFGDPDLKLLKNYNFDSFTQGAEGEIDIVVGPEPTLVCPNWIETDAQSSNNVLVIREAFYNWGVESASELRIEQLGPEPLPLTELDEPEFIRRLAAASRFMSFCHHTFSGGLTEQVLAEVGTNRFLLVDTSKDEHAANPSAGYVPAIYDLQPDEALIIEVPTPKAHYWNLHLGDVWWQVTNFTYHQSSLNGHQVKFDKDGKARIVIAAEDPGVANWLDPVGILKGVALLRWYLSDDYPTPKTKLVKPEDLYAELPPETQWVSLEQRAEALAVRRHAVLRRYGH